MARFLRRRSPLCYSSFRNETPASDRNPALRPGQRPAPSERPDRSVLPRRADPGLAPRAAGHYRARRTGLTEGRGDRHLLRVPRAHRASRPLTSSRNSGTRTCVLTLMDWKGGRPRATRSSRRSQFRGRASLSLGLGSPSRSSQVVRSSNWSAYATYVATARQPSHVIMSGG